MSSKLHNAEYISISGSRAGGTFRVTLAINEGLVWCTTSRGEITFETPNKTGLTKREAASFYDQAVIVLAARKTGVKRLDGGDVPAKEGAQ